MTQTYAITIIMIAVLSIIGGMLLGFRILCGINTKDKFIYVDETKEEYKMRKKNAQAYSERESMLSYRLSDEKSVIEEKCKACGENITEVITSQQSEVDGDFEYLKTLE